MSSRAGKKRTQAAVNARKRKQTPESSAVIAQIVVDNVPEAFSPNNLDSMQLKEPPTKVCVNVISLSNFLRNKNLVVLKGCTQNKKIKDVLEEKFGSLFCLWFRTIFKRQKPY